MTLLVLAEQAQVDVERLTEFLAGQLPHEAARTAQVLHDGLAILARHPEVGRPCGRGLRELVISRGNSGYLALYKYDAVSNVALVLAIRRQREAGYSLN